MGGEKLVLSFKDVSKSFGYQKVLSNLKFDIAQGEIFGIVGESGSGKSTLLKIIAGTMLPDSGDVLFKPKDLDGYSLIEPNSNLQSIFKDINALKRTVGYSPQDPSFYDKLNCQENIEFFGSLYNLPKEILKINIKILLRLVGLDKWNKKLAGDLSGGMQKRLDLACTLVHDPKILVLDEPTSDIDFILREQMWDLIRKIRQKGTTIVMSSHFIEEIEGLCDKIIILNNSKIEFIGSPSDLKKRDGAGLVIKLKTREKDYLLLKKKLYAKYSSKKLTIKHKENSGYLLLMLKGIKDPDKEVPKILHLIKLSNQNLVEFNYSKEGISEIFLELHEKSIEAPFKDTNLISEKKKIVKKSRKEIRIAKKLENKKCLSEKIALKQKRKSDKIRARKLLLDAKAKVKSDKIAAKKALVDDRKKIKLAKQKSKKDSFKSKSKPVVKSKSKPDSEIKLSLQSNVKNNSRKKNSVVKSKSKPLKKGGKK